MRTTGEIGAVLLIVFLAFGCVHGYYEQSDSPIIAALRTRDQDRINHFTELCLSGKERIRREWLYEFSPNHVYILVMPRHQMDAANHLGVAAISDYFACLRFDIEPIQARCCRR